LRHARAAIASGTDDATALAVAAFALGILSKDYTTAANVIERALSLNPSSAAAHYWGAIIHAASGNFAAVTAHANRALRLSPFDPLAFLAHTALGHEAVVEGHYDEAASHYAKAVIASPRFSIAYFCQAIALALAGRVEEARPIVQQLLQLNPSFRSSQVFDYAVVGPFATKVKEGARLLGLPE
jgi:adenylate cyclase